jgi:hypothetical protein
LACRTIKKLGNYINGKTKIQFWCLVYDCGYIWESSPDSILNGKKGCPKCAKVIKLTNDEVDSRLIGRKIKRLGDIINNHTKILWSCLYNICGHSWLATPKSILNRNSGCPKCAGCLRLTNEEVDKRLEGRNIKRLTDIIGAAKKMDFRCLICNYIWTTCPASILNSRKTGCPRCAGLEKLTNETIDNRLMINERNIKRIDDVINNRTKINFICIDCKNIWKATPNDILCGSGCNICNLPGLNEKMLLKLLIKNNINLEYQKQFKYIINAKSKMRVDFYLPKTNTIIEYNGEQHYHPVQFGGITEEAANINFLKQQKRDNHLKELCDINDIKLIYIDGRKYYGNKLKNYVINELILQIK